MWWAKGGQGIVNDTGSRPTSLVVRNHRSAKQHNVSAGRETCEGASHTEP